MKPSGNRIPYYIKEGISSIFRHSLMSFASVCIIFAFLLIMGAFILLAVNINSIIGELESENIVLAYVDDSLSELEALALQRAIAATPNVATVRFITREQATESFIGRHIDSDRYTDLDPTWFRHRYAVYVDDVEFLAETLEGIRQIYGIDTVNANLTIARAMVTIRNGIRIVSVVMIVALLAISLFVMTNTIKLATFERREEIAIMRIVGATNSFIRWPFIFEGCILGVLGSMSAYGAIWGLYGLVSDRVYQVEAIFIPIMPFSSVSMYLFMLFAAIGVSVGVGGSAVALNRYLKV